MFDRSRWGQPRSLVSRSAAGSVLLSLVALIYACGDRPASPDMQPSQSTAANSTNPHAITAAHPSTVAPNGDPCTYDVGSLNRSMVVTGGKDTVNVIATNGCQWTAEAQAQGNWLTITGGTIGGNGNGFIEYSVDTSSSPSSRQGSLIVAGQTLTISEAGITGPPPCTVSLSSTTASVGAAGDTQTVSITAPASCGWQAQSNVSFITVTSSPNGTGNGAVTYRVDTNSGAARTGTISIGTQALTVSQGAAASCSYQLSPTSVTSPAAGGPSSVTVTAGAGCSWTASTQTPWLHVTAGSSGNGNGTVTFSVDANAAAAQRSGNVTIAGQTVDVTQQGVSCTYTVSSTSINAGMAAGSSSVGVTAATGCSWTASTQTPWLHVTAGTPGSGNGTVGFSIDANTGPQRSGTLTVAGQTVTVVQASGCSYSVSPATVNVGSGAGSSSAGVTAGAECSWTAATQTPWLHITAGASGNGNGTVSFSIDANTLTTQRSGTLTIAGQTVTVTQAAGCTYGVTPTSFQVPFQGTGEGFDNVNVTSGAGCSWTATTQTPWLHLRSGAPGTGNGTVNFTVDSNSGAQRTGTWIIAGQTVTVTQAALNTTLVVTYSIPQVCSALTVNFSPPGTNPPPDCQPNTTTGSCDQRTYSLGTNVAVSVTGLGQVTWANCDSVANGVCNVAMNSDRCLGCTLPNVRVTIVQSCIGVE